MGYTSRSLLEVSIITAALPGLQRIHKVYIMDNILEANKNITSSSVPVKPSSDPEGTHPGKAVTGQILGEDVARDDNETSTKANFEIESINKIVNDDDKSKLMTVQDVVDALRVIVSQGSSLRMPVQADMLGLVYLVLDRPRDVARIEVAELKFREDANQEWCLMSGRIRDYSHGAPVNYEEYILKFLSCADDLFNEFYVRYRIDSRIYLGSARVMDPEALGMDHSLANLSSPGMEAYMEHSKEVYRRIHLNKAQYAVNRILNPALHEFENCIQDKVDRDDGPLRKWMTMFSERKRLLEFGGAHPIYGENNVRWEHHAAPRHLPTFLGWLPRFSELSVAYASTFMFPECAPSMVSIGDIVSTMQTNANRADPLADLGTAAVTSKNNEDFKRILMAMILPQQCMLEIRFDMKLNATIKAFSALVAKMMFSVTPSFRNILYTSAQECDLQIGNWLRDLGCVSTDADRPLRLISGKLPTMWDQIETDVCTGRGWCNTDTRGEYHISNPLYDGINTLPQYCGILDHTVIDNDLVLSDIADPPIFSLIMECLSGMRKTRDIDAVSRVLNYNRVKYKQFFSYLNRHIVLYGETGFRLPDGRRWEMDNIYVQGGYNANVLNVPVRLQVDSDSLFKFFIRMPSLMKVSERVLRQPIAESSLSGSKDHVFIPTNYAPCLWYR